MHFRAVVRAAVLGSLLALVLAFSGVMASGGYDYGSQTCTLTRTVYIYTQSSVVIDVYWYGGHHVQYSTPYQTYHATSTSYTSTWWTVEYDYQRISNGAACEQ